MKKLFVIIVLPALILLSLFPAFAEDCLHSGAAETDNFCSQCGETLADACEKCGTRKSDAGEYCPGCGSKYSVAENKGTTVVYIVLSVGLLLMLCVGTPAFLSEVGFFEYLKEKREQKKKELGKEKIIIVSEPHEGRWQAVGGEKEEKEENTNVKGQ